jgi:hypothetical protein
MVMVNLKKGHIFNSQHFKIVMRTPKWKDKDMDDDYDIQQAKFKLYEELQVLLRDEVLPALSVYEVSGAVVARRKELPDGRKSSDSVS